MSEQLDLFGKTVERAAAYSKNSSGECDMCGTLVKSLYPCRVGQVDFLICGNCKGIMDL